MPVVVPSQFQLLAFVFAALFPGQVRHYYVRFRWWGIVLHGASGLLLGIGVLGGSFMKAQEHSFIEAWIRKFSECNLRLFSHAPELARGSLGWSVTQARLQVRLDGDCVTPRKLSSL